MLIKFFCFLTSISSKFMIVFSIFICGFKIFHIFLIYNFLLFSLKSTFWRKFIVCFISFYIYTYKGILWVIAFYNKMFFSCSVIFFSVLNKLFFQLFRDLCSVHDHIATFFYFSPLDRFWYFWQAIFL